MIACSSISPSRSSRSVAAAEEVVEVLPADRLDHLDRDELVVAAAQVAVVLAAAPSTRSSSAGFADPPARQVVLLARDRRRRHPAAVRRRRRGSPGRPSRCRSPAGGRRDRGRSRLADPLELAPAAPPRGSRPGEGSRRTSTSSTRRGRPRRGRCRGRSGRRCWRARPSRVFSGTRLGAAGAAAARAAAADGAARRRAARARGRRSGRRDEVVARPRVRRRSPRPAGRAAHRPRVGAPVVDLDRHLWCGPIVAEAKPALALDDRQPTAADPGEEAEHGAASELVPHCDRCGCGYQGAPLSRRRSACQ